MLLCKVWKSPLNITGKWLQAKIISEVVIPMIVLASLSSAQKAGIMMCFRNVVVTANLAAGLLLTVEQVANWSRRLTNASLLLIVFESNANDLYVCCWCFTLTCSSNTTWHYYMLFCCVRNETCDYLWP